MQKTQTLSKQEISKQPLKFNKRIRKYTSYFQPIYPGKKGSNMQYPVFKQIISIITQHI